MTVDRYFIFVLLVIYEKVDWIKAGFLPKFWEFWLTGGEILKFYEFLLDFGCSVQSEVFMQGEFYPSRG